MNNLYQDRTFKTRGTDMHQEWTYRQPGQTAHNLAEEAFDQIRIGEQFEYGQYWVEQYDSRRKAITSPYGLPVTASYFHALGTDGTYGDLNIIVYFTDLHQRVVVYDYTKVDNDLHEWPEENWTI